MGGFLGDGLSLFVVMAKQEQHVDDFSRHVHAVVHILQRCRNYYNACMENKSFNTIQKGVRWIGWKAPEEGWVKLNTDGASNGKGLSAGMSMNIYGRG
jgi:hypothetical protein